MASPYAVALAAADQAFDEHLGELVEIVPMSTGPYAVGADTSRPAFEILALCDYVQPSAADVGKLLARYAHEETHLEIRRALLPPGISIRKDDHVRLIERAGRPVLKISRFDDTDPERIAYTLARLADGEG